MKKHNLTPGNHLSIQQDKDSKISGDNKQNQFEDSLNDTKECHYFYIPKNLDIDSLLVKYSFRHITAFHKDNLYYILNLIVEIPANNKDLIDEDGYTPVNAEILKKWIGREYPKYVQWLIDAMVIETKGHFIVGKKSKGFKYCEKYNNGIKKSLVTLPNLIEKLDEYNASYVNSKSAVSKIQNCKRGPRNYESESVYSPIAKWYRSGLIRIDKQLANDFNDRLLEYRLEDLTKSRWDTKPEKNGKTIRKNPIIQHYAGFINIDKIASGIFNAHPDENVFRYHSTITNTKKELRNAITIDNKEVAAVDLSNSQPTLLTILLNPDFLTGTGSNFNHISIPGFNLKDAIPNHSKFNLLITLSKNAQNNGEHGSEFNEYKEIVGSGQFYPVFKARVERELKTTLSDRDIKSRFFTVLFTHNSFIAQPEAASKRVFRDWFPQLYKMTSLIKSKHSPNLPILLQRLESYIILYNGYRDKVDTEKAIYRLSTIGIVDDYTVNFSSNTFTLFGKKKLDKAYEENLKTYLLKYYSEKTTNIRLGSLNDISEPTSIRKSLNFLVNFVYDNIRSKRLQAIKDMKSACKQSIEKGIDGSVWLKDYIDLYFNSKYARSGYKYIDKKGIEINASLTDITENGRKDDLKFVWFFMNVVDQDDSGGSQIDNLKHLRGACTRMTTSIIEPSFSIKLLAAFAVIRLFNYHLTI